MRRAIDRLSVSGAAASDFALSAAATPFSVLPGASTAITATFTPSVGTARLATLLIDDNGFDAPQFVNLAGSGTFRADLAVSLGASSASARNRSKLTYTISVRNGGPTAAPAVTVNDILPDGTVFTSSQATQGTCLTPAPGASGALKCDLGTLNNGATATVTLVVTVQSIDRPTLLNTATATSGATDPDLGNNSASIATAVFGPKR